MSYLFDGTNDRLAGSFSSTYNAHPLTIAAFIKIAAHPVAVDVIATLGNSSSSNNDSHRIGTSSVDDRWWATSTTSAGAASEAVLSSVNIDGVWAGIVGRFTSATEREIFVQSLANTASDATSQVLTDALQHIALGENLGGTNDFAGLIAEVAMWRTDISDANITAFMTGTAASAIAPSDLIGYWPLSADNATQDNLGIDAGGDLAVSGAVFDADHPTITTASIARLARFYEMMRV